MALAIDEPFRPHKCHSDRCYRCRRAHACEEEQCDRKDMNVRTLVLDEGQSDEFVEISVNHDEGIVYIRSFYDAGYAATLDGKMMKLAKFKEKLGL